MENLGFHNQMSGIDRMTYYSASCRQPVSFLFLRMRIVMQIQCIFIFSEFIVLNFIDFLAGKMILTGSHPVRVAIDYSYTDSGLRANPELKF